MSGYTVQDTGVMPGMKSPALAAIISIILPGIGTLYAGKAVKGIVLLLASWILAFLLIGFLIWLYAIYDGYSTAKQYNWYVQQHGQPPPW